MPRLILSRKGLDAGNGGKPSPILGDTLIPLPIPQVGTGIKYLHLQNQEDQPMPALLTQLGIVPDQEIHLDPDLAAGALPARPEGWKPIFGQRAASLSHLDNEGVGVGDLFLFYGWFKAIEWKHSSWVYRRDAQDLHVIYGYLQVGEMMDLTKQQAPAWAAAHPHVVCSPAFNPGGNRLFVAAKLAISHRSIPAQACFPGLRPGS